MNKISVVTSLAVIHMCVACSGERDGDGLLLAAVDLNLVMGPGDADTLNGPVHDASREFDALHAESAKAFVRHIEFYLPVGTCVVPADAGNESALERACDDKVRVDGPWVVDLMTGEATPSMANIRVPAGVYRRVDVRFEDADKHAVETIDVPAELKDWTLVATGGYDGSVATNFDLRLKFNNDARFQSEGGIAVSAQGANEMTMELDVERWFSAVSLDDCFDKGRLEVVEHTLLIEDEGKRCNAVENAIKEAMKHPHRLDD